MCADLIKMPSNWPEIEKKFYQALNSRGLGKMKRWIKENQSILSLLGFNKVYDESYSKSHIDLLSLCDHLCDRDKVELLIEGGAPFHSSWLNIDFLATKKSILESTLMNNIANQLINSYKTSNDEMNKERVQDYWFKFIQIMHGQIISLDDINDIIERSQYYGLKTIKNSGEIGPMLSKKISSHASAVNNQITKDNLEKWFSLIFNKVQRKSEVKNKIAKDLWANYNKVTYFSTHLTDWMINQLKSTLVIIRKDLPEFSWQAKLCGYPY